MTVNSYLTNLASRAILRDDEKVSVLRSITTLQSRIALHFGSQVGQHFVFGSYSRDTILPRTMDPQSDVDYLVTFSDALLQPQSYLDRLRRFAEMKYPLSEVAQSHPTVVLELSHLRFELVPAMNSILYGMQIPNTESNYARWQQTDPTGFNDRLTRANQANGNLIKPLARVMKYWNARAGYPFESFALEQKVAGYGYALFGALGPRQIGDMFYQITAACDAGFLAPQWKRDAVARLKQLGGQARTQERSGNVIQAEATIKRLLPPVVGWLGV